MIKSVFKKENIRPLLAIFISLVCVLLNKIINYSAGKSYTAILLEAMIFSLAILATYFLIFYSKNYYLGLIAGIFVMKTIPPALPELFDFNPQASILYYSVSAVAVIIFVLALINLYKKQTKVDILPILAMIFVVPFFNKIGLMFESYYAKIDEMPYSVTSVFVCYAIAQIVILILACYFKGRDAKFVIDYSLLAMAFAFLKKLIGAGIRVISGNTLEYSYYCYLGLYLAFIFALIAISNIKKINAEKSAKKELEEVAE